MRNTKDKSTDTINIISHEIKTPISIAKLYIEELLQNKKYQDTYIKDKLHKSIKYIDKSIQLLNNLLALNQIEQRNITITPIEFDIIESIEDIINVWKINNKDIKIVRKYPKSLNVKLDQIKVEQIFTNIFSNAIKYTKNGSITITLKKIKSKLMIDITDTGIGIPKKYLDKIGDKYFQAHLAPDDFVKSNGLGLGLYITINLIKQLNGTYRIKSMENKGTQFIISIAI